MTEIMTTDYIPESAQDLINRAELLLDPSIQTTSIQRSIQTTSISVPQIRTLNPACYRVVVQGVVVPVTVTEISIVKCTGSDIGDCPDTIPAACPTGLLPTDYINMLAIVETTSAQSGVNLRFEYLLDDIPTYTDVTVDLDAGSNAVYAFATNAQYSAGQSLTLYDVKVI